jgi:beta-phosphoglucomutase-like phosphatase (HAD superfamily)
VSLPISLVIFDCDGVLVDTERIARAAGMRASGSPAIPLSGKLLI